jgi:DNA-binding response OmpR family regulator
MRILLVEDLPHTARSIERLLVRSGHNVVLAPHAEAAKDWLVEGPFDLIIADYGLGSGETGLDVLRFCGREFPGIARILISGAIEGIPPEDAVVFLGKPFSRDQLVNAIRTVSRKD